MLHKLLRELPGGVRPTHLAVIFDKSEVSFRNEMFDGYKANRPAPPSDLIPQFAVIRQAVRAFSVPCIEQGGYEADDLIATYARQAVEQGATVRIVSSDKDLMQLVSDGIKLYDTMKDRDIGEPEVLEKFGVPPSKVGDVLALAGDSVDNVPGVPGIGVKTGAQLINEYGDLETVLARAGEIKQPKRRECLELYADQARLSRRLVELKSDVPVEEPLESFAVRSPDPRELVGFLKTMEFTTPRSPYRNGARRRRFADRSAAGEDRRVDAERRHSRRAAGAGHRRPRGPRQARGAPEDRRRLA